MLSSHADLILDNKSVFFLLPLIGYMHNLTVLFKNVSVCFLLLI